jgi:hypothetical protein
MAANQNLRFQEYVNTHAHLPNIYFNVYSIVKSKKRFKDGFEFPYK